MSISKKKQRGFSMIEVLVSLIVIGVGMLGLTGLQIASMKGTNNAHSRNIANMIAFEMSDRMRANPDGVVNGNYDNSDGTLTCNSNVKFCRGATSCSSEEIALFDIKEVMCGMKKIANDSTPGGGVANLLSSGELLIENNTDCAEITTTNKYKITVGWSAAKLDKNQHHDVQSQEISICTRL